MHWLMNCKIAWLLWLQQPFEPHYSFGQACRSVAAPMWWILIAGANANRVASIKKQINVAFKRSPALNRNEQTAENFPLTLSKFQSLVRREKCMYWAPPTMHLFSLLAKNFLLSPLASLCTQTHTRVFFSSVLLVIKATNKLIKQKLFFFTYFSSPAA